VGYPKFRSKSVLLAHLLSLACFASVSTSALADSLPQDLIPPDVTLTPHTGSTTSSTPTPSDSSTPGIGSGVSAGNQPPTPPAGSNAPSKYSGFASAPPGTPGGHKGMPFYPPGQQPMAQSAAGQPSTPDPIAVIDTNRGQITIRLFKQHAPKTVEAFQEMVTQGFYNGLLWHRVEPGFVIQGGCPNGNGSGMYVDPKTNQPRMLMLETSPQVKHNMAGVVAMARFPKNPNSASCQFYITLAPKANLDYKYTIFGGVISGMDVVNRIQKGDKMENIRIQQ